ncbi:MAG: hypothetical protein AAF797_10130 [Planctomycetota bacterium]
MAARHPNPPGMYCKDCLYDLSGTAAEPDRKTYACPECGRAFDPRRPHTTLRQPIGRRLRFGLRAPWLLTAGFVVLGLNTVWAALDTDRSIGPLFPYTICLTSLLFIAWAGRLCAFAGLLLFPNNRRLYRMGRLDPLAWTSPVWVILVCWAILMVT